jgi:hypothetical protein
MKKRLFQILDEMNVHDIEHKTEMVAVSSNFIAADKVKQGAVLKMGAPESVLADLFADSVMPVLLILDKKEYQKRKEEKS